MIYFLYDMYYVCRVSYRGKDILHFLAIFINVIGQ